jgi:DNA repair protein RadC
MSNTHLRGIQIGSRCRPSKICGGFESGIVSEFGTLENLNQATVTEMYQIKDIGAAKAIQIKALQEVEKRIALKPKGVKIKLKSSQAFVEKFFPFLRNLKKEIVKIVLLEPKLQLIKYLTIWKGSLNFGIIQSHEFMPPTILESATSFSLIHNHPSGKTNPIQKYFEVTDLINQTGKIIRIHIFDHIIIGVNGFFSFADEGLL